MVDERAFGTTSRGTATTMYGKKKKPTLMPLVALGGLCLAVTLPALSSTVHAAPPVAYTTVTVHPGQTLWSLAESRTAPNGDVQSTVDQIIATNHLSDAGLHVGQKLRVPR
ncbi:MAG TPA: LysM peptidoglycan-binding domain-containing protein [Candidatus Elarobacter sp.]|nr:LysM peptidoglycan-binding domain-containing protein [Candidatus Elarobacter sp.]